MGLISWLFGAILFVLDVIAIASVINSDATGGRKLMWIAIIVLLPVIGFIAWFLFGPKMAVARR
ncbi:PLDc N-terminal domain-containing protein [Paracoccus sp. p4-l81]|uniref:PLDc N-terminal domain-containing protein n=1 Tax=unclassified Paracoccus (in: a-proteobacteria) TaxID=2688777 RepID=UPI0035B8F363